MVSVLTQIFLLAAALSADIFAVGFTYGAGGIRLSPAAAFLLTGIPAVILTLSMGLGGAADSNISLAHSPGASLQVPKTVTKYGNSVTRTCSPIPIAKAASISLFSR